MLNLVNICMYVTSKPFKTRMAHLMEDQRQSQKVLSVYYTFFSCFNPSLVTYQVGTLLPKILKEIWFDLILF